MDWCWNKALTKCWTPAGRNINTNTLLFSIGFSCSISSTRLPLFSCYVLNFSLSFNSILTLLPSPLTERPPSFSLFLSLSWLSHALLRSSSTPLFPQSTVDKVNLNYSAHPYTLQSLVLADFHECHNAPASTNSFKPTEIPFKRLHLQRLLLGMVLHGKHGPVISQSHQPWESQLLKDQGEKEAAAASSMSPSPWTHELIWEDSGGYQEDGGEQDPKAQ